MSKKTLVLLRLKIHTAHFILEIFLRNPSHVGTFSRYWDVLKTFLGHLLKRALDICAIWKLHSLAKFVLFAILLSSESLEIRDPFVFDWFIWKFGNLKSWDSRKNSYLFKVSLVSSVFTTIDIIIAIVNMRFQITQDLHNFLKFNVIEDSLSLSLSIHIYIYIYIYIYIHTYIRIIIFHQYSISLKTGPNHLSPFLTRHHIIVHILEQNGLLLTTIEKVSSLQI